MARKQMIEGGTKNRIREVGGRQIFEHGYDGTSVRGIMLEVGGEVGLFYYYYKTKDELFTDVLDHFFEPYRKDFEALAAEAKEKPYRALLRFFSYIKREVRAFRAKYEGNMHRTVRWAIREQTLTVIEPYIEDIIRTLMTCGAKPTMDPHTMAIFLAHGLGSCILHEDADWVDEATDDMRRTVNLIMGLSEEESRKMFEDADGKANAPAAVEGEKKNEMKEARIPVPQPAAGDGARRAGLRRVRGRFCRRLRRRYARRLAVSFGRDRAEQCRGERRPARRGQDRRRERYRSVCHGRWL